MRPVLGWSLVATLLAAGPAASAEEKSRSAPPDLSVVPPEQDVLERMRACDPQLYARAVSGDRMVGAGAGLLVVGTLAVPIGFLQWMADAWSCYGEPTSCRSSSRGGFIAAGGALALAGGVALVVAGRDRRDEAVRAFQPRHVDQPSTR